MPRFDDWGFFPVRLETKNHRSCPRQKLKTCSVVLTIVQQTAYSTLTKKEVHNNSVVWFVRWRESPHVRNETIYICFLTDGIYFGTRKLFGFKWFEPGNTSNNCSSFDYAQLQAMVPPTQITILFLVKRNFKLNKKELIELPKNSHVFSFNFTPPLKSTGKGT